MRAVIAISAIYMLLFSSVSHAQDDVVAVIFDEPVSLASLSPDDKTLSQFARMNSASKDMALAQYRHAMLSDKIFRAVLDDYAAKNNIEVDPSLVKKFKQRFAASLNAPSMNDEQRQSADEIAEKQVLRWQIDRALYNEYGGTVVFQQSNPQMPAKAYEILLKSYRDKGAFRITDDRFRAVFWEAIEPPYPFVLSPDKIDFSQPWWLN